MSEEKEIIAYLRLQKTPLVGDITAKRLIHHFGRALAIFENSKTLLEIDGVGTKIAQALQNEKYQQEAEKEWDYIQKNNIQFASFQDENYPIRLKQCIDSPILVFYRGNINFDNQKVISIVGTRQATSYGINFCENLVKELAQWNPIIVSGFAYGIDIVAHKSAVKNGLQTIGCLAHGLDTIYPKAHQKYMSEVESNGGFLTDFGHKSKFDRKNFLGRNRIIAGLSDATIVIESAKKGGSLVTADIAFSYNREVFAVPGRTIDPYSIGCNHLIKTEKARILTSAEDVAYQLGWDLEKQEKTAVQSQLFIELEDEEEAIYDFLKQQGKQLIDVIALECQIPIHKLSHLLFQMEMKGAIRPLPGKVFEAI